MSENILEVHGLTKEFAGVRALDNIEFSVEKGEIHALMGENGAGKSTLIKILTGLYKADAGQIIFDHEERKFTTVQSAQKAGVSTIYQELNMIPYLTVSENIFLGHYPYNQSGIDWKKMHEDAQALIDEVGIDIDVRKTLNNYSTAKQQIISIIRAVNFNCKLLIMDEPTSSLDTNEVEILFGIMDKMKAKGVSMIFISHRLDEVYKKCDRITVLKDGHYMGTQKTEELSEYELLKTMLGKKEVKLERTLPIRDFSDKEDVLEVKNLIRVPYVNDVSFHIKKGEILGLAGLLGAGRTETARIIFGCDHPDSGEIYVEGKQVKIKSPEDAIKAGLAFCTENRREEGIFPDVTVQNNLTICSLDNLTKGGFINSKKRKQLSDDYIQKLLIKTPSGEQLIKNLSGGNQQKVILSRWMAIHPKLIILDEPTRGIDVGAKAEIEKLIHDFSANGISVLFISSEMAELVRNCDRILVLRDGKAMGELSGGDISEKSIMETIATGKEK